MGTTQEHEQHAHGCLECDTPEQAVTFFMPHPMLTQLCGEDTGLLPNGGDKAWWVTQFVEKVSKLLPSTTA